MSIASCLMVLLGQMGYGHYGKFINVFLCDWFVCIYALRVFLWLGCKALWVSESSLQIPIYYYCCNYYYINLFCKLSSFISNQKLGTLSHFSNSYGNLERAARKVVNKADVSKVRSKCDVSPTFWRHVDSGCSQKRTQSQGKLDFTVSHS